MNVLFGIKIHLKIADLTDISVEMEKLSKKLCLKKITEIF